MSHPILPIMDLPTRTQQLALVILVVMLVAYVFLRVW